MKSIPKGFAAFSIGLARYSCSNAALGNEALASSISEGKINGLSYVVNLNDCQSPVFFK